MAEGAMLDPGLEAGRKPDVKPGMILLSDEMVYKLNKKIAQLTKVIYSLNTKNDDLELKIERLKKEGPGEKNIETQELELKKELRNATSQLRQYELKLKNIEENHTKKMKSESAMLEKSDLQVDQSRNGSIDPSDSRDVERRKLERLRLEYEERERIKIEELRTEHEDKERRKIEELRTEYEDIERRKIEELSINYEERFEKMKYEYETEVKSFRDLALSREDELNSLKAEVSQIKCDLLAEEPRHEKKIEQLLQEISESGDKLSRVEEELAQSQETTQSVQLLNLELQEQVQCLQTTVAQRENYISQLNVTLEQTKADMGKTQEELSRLEKELSSSKNKIKEKEKEIESLTKKQLDNQSDSNLVKDLETALEEAIVEREQILAACEKEIEQERNIAIELEQKMMEDFEWKLRELEREHRQTIKTLEESIELRIGEKEREMNRQKDKDLTTMCIQARRDMEKNISQNMKTARDTANCEKETIIKDITAQKDREIKVLNQAWDREKKVLERDIAAQVNKVRAENDQKMLEMGRKHDQVVEKYQEEYDLMRDEMEGKLNRLRAENTEKIEEYESKISNLLSGKTDTICQIKEGVESEFLERMTGLREIYRTEMLQQQELYAKDLEKWKDIERCLNLKLTEKKQEVNDNIAYYTQRESELETKIDELMTRLQEQTANYIKLQTEFDNCEWWEEEEENKEPSQQSTKPSSRPPSRGRTHNMHLNSTTVSTDFLEHTTPKSGRISLKEDIFYPMVGQDGSGPELIPRRVERGTEEYIGVTTDEDLTTKRNSTASGSGKSNKKSNCTQQ